MHLRLSHLALIALATAALVGSAGLAAPALASDAPPRLDPARLVAVVAGVLAWDEPALPSFSKVNRKDVALHALLGELGVPEARRALLVDEQATARAVKGALRRAIAGARRGDTLLFYFTGHGIKHGAGKIIFATTETRARKKSGLHLDELPPLFGERFAGERVILLADACHSGGLAQVARALAKQGIEVVALTSAEVSNLSTGNWTFTQAVIDCLGGSPLCDGDGDGRVTLAELRAEARETMLYREQQQVGWDNHGVAEGLVLAARRDDDPALAAGQPRRGEWVAIEHEGRPRVGRILGARGGEALVSLYGYNAEVRVTVPEAGARPVVYRAWPVGTELMVMWNRKAYRARVERVDGWLHYITYPGWSAAWNEWVGPDRIVGAAAAVAGGEGGGGPNAGGPPSGFDAPAAAAGAGDDDASGGGVAVGAGPFEVEWRGSWYRAERTGERDGLICIRYVGWGDHWDECVTADRIRLLP